MATGTEPDIGVTQGAWNALVRRSRIGRERKAVAMVVSSYANADGTGIHCGVARLAVDCEIGYSTARRYLAWLRDVGLIEMVRAGNQRRRLSDEYRLILGPDLLEHLEVPDPDEYDALRDTLRDANRASQRARRERVQRSAKVSADEGPVEPVDNHDQRSSEASADAVVDNHDQRSPNVSAETADQRSPRRSSALTQDEPPPTLYTYPEELTYPKTGEELRTDLAVARARDNPLRLASSNPDPEPSTTPRGLFPAAVAATARGHGFCLACYGDGRVTVATDPIAGTVCAHHLAEAAS